MPLCEICTSCIQSLRPQAAGELQRQEISRLPSPVQVTLPKFQRTRVYSCWICLKFTHWLEIEGPDIFAKWNTQPLRVEYSTHSRSHASPPEVLTPFCVGITPQSCQSHELYFDAEVNFFLAEEYVAPAIATVKSHGPSSVDLDLIKTWINRCTTDHVKCKVDTEMWYPSRLLQLDHHTRKVKLIITKNKHLDGHYMTLSHRWGPTSYVQLESSTMARLQENVDVAGLPKVFQDTIEIAYTLGIQYLWIDALCIKQDQIDKSDWNVESLNMGKVYSNAFINVSATLSSTGHESLFRERSCGPFLPSEVEFDISGINRTYYAVDGDLWFDEISDAPLSKRGWVFQERFLARRVLHFGERQLGWECRELDALEIFPAGLPRYIILSSMVKEQVYDQLAALNRDVDDNLNKAFVDQWHSLVSEYAKCKLSFGTDKVVAFAGVAECMMRYRTDRYVAGMWEDTLVYDLAWWRSTDDRDTLPISETRSRAPSWSWACVDGEINWPDTLGGFRHAFARAFKFVQSSSNADLSAETEIIRTEAVCLPLTIDFRSGKALSMKVAGLCFPVEEGRDPHSFTSGSHISLECTDDEIRLLSQQGKVLVLILFASGYALYGTVLSKLRGVGAHRRLGAVQFPLKREKIAKIVQPSGTSERSAQINGTVRPHRDPWMVDRRSEVRDQNDGNETLWNRDTVKLMYHVRDKQRPRVIEIC